MNRFCGGGTRALGSDKERRGEERARARDKEEGGEGLEGGMDVSADALGLGALWWLLGCLFLYFIF